jgi:two-component system LytT family response regulator
MKCFLIGDNKDVLESIESYLYTNFFYITICEKANSYIEAERMLQKMKPDLLLLDITKNIEIPSIFLKKLNKYAIDTLAIIRDQNIISPLKNNNVVYITKPTDYAEFRFYINTFYINKTKEEELQQILMRMRDTAPKKRIAISQEKQIQMVALDGVLYIEADINYCQIHFLDKKSICVSKTLKSFDQQLVNNNEFYRIHQSYIINLNYINKVIKTKLPQVVMINGDILSISRSKKASFFRLILK